MMKAAILVDFNNIFGGDFENHQIVATKIELALKEVVEQILNQFLEIDSIIIRLYGGWYKGETLSNKASKLLQMKSEIKPIPSFFNGRRIRGSFDFVTSLYGDDFIWYNTYREKKGPRLNLSSSHKTPLCDNNTDKCAISLIRRLTKKGTKLCLVPNCNSSNEDVLVQIGQKMVDSIIGCDLLSLSKEDDMTAIVVLSDDVDIYPSLALVRINNSSIHLILGLRHTLDSKLESDKVVLDHFNIKTTYINYDNNRI